MKVKGIKKVAAIMLSLLLVGMLMPVIQAKADGDIEINETNFPDTNFRNFIKSQNYGDGNDVLTPAEIAGVTSMDCRNKNISNLKGIEYFTSLETLDCRSNQLTSLDMSSNTALKELHCQFNQLTALEVSSNTALTHLYCNFNDLSSLDVSNNTALTEIFCVDNELTALDVSKNIALTELYCGHNELTALEVSSNTALTTLDCNTNQLTSLDVRGNTALIALYCYSNPLTSLKVPFENGTKTATVSNGGYGTFNCSNISFSEKTLTIADPTLTSTDPAYTFKEWNCTGATTENAAYGTKFTVGDTAATITAVWEVAINATNFPDDNFRSFIKSQNYGDGNDVLTPAEIADATSMDCSDQNISNLKGIEYFTALTGLVCSSNQLTSLDVSKNKSLMNLICYNNNLTSLDVSNNTALIYLYCKKNQLKSIDLSKNKSLMNLNCSLNPLASLIVPFDNGTKTATVSNGGHGTFDCTEISILYPNNALTIADPTSADLAYSFKEWSVTGATQTAVEGGTKFSIDPAATTITITAVWDHELTLTIKEIYQNANGSIERTVTTTEIATEGETKTVTKTAPSGYTIVGESTQTVTMDSDKTITFTYRKKSSSSGGSSGGGYVPPAHRVTYTDGVEDIVFEDETYYVSAGRKTPDFKGKTEREGYTFKGWSPEVTKTVTRSVTYTAIWEEDDPKKPDPDEPDPLKPVPVKIYRLYNPGGYHFFTSDINERDYLISLGWVDEGTGFVSTDKAMILVYRVYNPNNGDHFFTVDLDEAVQLKSFGWIFEGIGFYSFEEGVPVYRLYNPNSGGEHFYTMDIAERDALIELGWCDEGVAFYMTDGL